MYIHDFDDLSWERVCKVKSTHFRNEWYYENIDRNLMFSTHRSWVYAITVDGRIVKIGETGNPLGIEGIYTYDNFDESQPKCGTMSRLGRYRKGSDTDQVIRDSLRNETKNNNVEFYAYRCPEMTSKMTILGESVDIKAQIHKHLEKIILDKIKRKDGSYPWLNTGRC